MEYYPNYSLIQNASESAAWSSNLPQGLDLEVSRHPITMRHIVKLIIAMERLKGGEGVTMGTEFKDKDLINFFLESAVEEQIVLELESAPPASRRAAGFISTSQYEYSITDSENKSLVLMKESMELHAMMLQGGSGYHKVHFNMCMYVTPVPIETEARPVALGIKGSNLYLSCSKSGGRPTLHLEEVEDKEQLKSISNQSDMVRFLFYRRNTGVDITTLESAGFRNWFISTAMQQDNAKPVDMCKKEAPNRLTTFTILRHN